MNKTTEPAAPDLSRIEPIDYVYRGSDGLIYRTVPQHVPVIETIPRYSAATVERLVQERDEANTAAEKMEAALFEASEEFAKQLAASQAREQQLREALEKLLPEHAYKFGNQWLADTHGKTIDVSEYAEHFEALAGLQFNENNDLVGERKALRDQLAADVARLQAENEALRKDAERWRFFRIADWADWNAVFRVDHDGLSLPELLDKATDAAMKGE